VVVVVVVVSAAAEAAAEIHGRPIIQSSRTQMSAFALLQRVQDVNPDLENCGHSPQSISKHFKKEGRFIAFMALTLVAVLLLQNAVTKLLDVAVRFTFPDSAIKGSILELVWSTLLIPIIITLGAF
jgi:hypothetical protein